VVINDKSLTWCIFLLSLSVSPVNAAEPQEQPENVAMAEISEPPTPPSEMYLAVIAGRANVDDSNVTATYDCILCTPVTVSKNVEFENGDTQIVRFGEWGVGGYEYAGISAELTRTGAHSGQVEAEYYALSVMPALRYPLFKTSSMPSGHVNLYMGLALSWTITGDISVQFPEFPTSKMESDDVSGNGTGVFAGVSARYSNFALLFEWRKMDMSLTGDVYLGGNVDLSVNTSQSLLGVAYYFR